MDTARSPAPALVAPAADAEPFATVLPATETGRAGERIAHLEELCRLAECGAVGLSPDEFADALHAAGERCRYNLPPANVISATQRDLFYRGLHLSDLALAHACALGRDTAWELFLARYREPLLRAAIAITGSASLGSDLADALPSELFGLTAREGERRSPLLSYSGRGSLLGWLRSTLAQRHVDAHRRTRRETPLGDVDFAAAQADSNVPNDTLHRLQSAVRDVLQAAPAEDAFILSSWFLDGRTLLRIARLLRVSEATMSRRVKRLTAGLRKQLTDRLLAGGLSRRAAEEALGSDPRDLTLNLRGLLQERAASAFPDKTIAPPGTPVL